MVNLMNHSNKLSENTGDGQPDRGLHVPTVFKEPRNSITFAKIQHEIV